LHNGDCGSSITALGFISSVSDYIDYNIGREEIQEQFSQLGEKPFVCLEDVEDFLVGNSGFGL
jgi:hypothetical protein